MMKFTTGILSCFVCLGSFDFGVVFAFSAIAPKQTSPKIPNIDPIDKTMKGVDSLESKEFDPTDGDENAAVKRNNYDEVWVSQVCAHKMLRICFSLVGSKFTNLT